MIIEWKTKLQVEWKIRKFRVCKLWRGRWSEIESGIGRQLEMKARINQSYNSRWSDQPLRYHFQMKVLNIVLQGLQI